MPIVDLFFKEKRKPPQVYQYDNLPRKFRVQVVHIWTSALGVPQYDGWGHAPPQNQWWRRVHDTLARELGIFALVPSLANSPNHMEQCVSFVLESNVDEALSIIQLSFNVIEDVNLVTPKYDLRNIGVSQDSDDAITELNARFMEHGIGYRYAAGRIIRADSEYLHAEVVQPALALLHATKFAGPLDEFLKAHEHYRKGNTKEAINEALKAFESTMKAICNERGLHYQQDAAAKHLIEVMIAGGLIPKHLTNHLSGLRAALEGGLPTLRNKQGAHGQGGTPLEVPRHVAGYALHLAASNIVFLLEAHHHSKTARSDGQR